VDNARNHGAPVPPPPPLLQRQPVVRAAAPSVPRFAEDSDLMAPESAPRARTNIVRLLESQMQLEIAANGALRRELAELRDEEIDVEERRTLVCRGVKVILPTPVEDNWPHGVGHEVGVTWTPPNEESHIRSLYCWGFVDAIRERDDLDAAACYECAKLIGDTKLMGLVGRASDEGLHLSSLPNKHLTRVQLQRRLRHRNQAWRDLSLKALTQSSKLALIAKVPSASNRMLTALAVGNLPRLHIIARRLLKGGATLQTIAREVERAVDGYVPKGEWDRNDYQKAFALLALGGRRALRINAAVDGGPSRRTLKRQALYKIPRHVACPGTVKVASLRENLWRTFGANPPGADEVLALHHVAFDNVNLDERAVCNFTEVGALGGLRVARESTFEGELTIHRSRT
jgi:hypothetical protein